MPRSSMPTKMVAGRSSATAHSTRTLPNIRFAPKPEVLFRIFHRQLVSKDRGDGVQQFRIAIADIFAR
jgi:hypothetical protein